MVSIVLDARSDQMGKDSHGDAPYNGNGQIGRQAHLDKARPETGEDHESLDLDIGIATEGTVNGSQAFHDMFAEGGIKR